VLGEAVYVDTETLALLFAGNSEPHKCCWAGCRCPRSAL
jgi:hypothetical protein